MNTAFLLVTSALMVGQPAAKPATLPPAAPAPIVASSCGPTCGQDACGCEGFGHRLREKLRGLFSRDCCDTCKPTACTAPACHCGCPKWTLNFKPAWRTSCAPAPTCRGGCDFGGGNFMDRLHERFHRADPCCCGGCEAVAPSPAPAKTEAPKRMPEASDGGAKKPQQVPIRTPQAMLGAPIPTQELPADTTVEVTPHARDGAMESAAPHNRLNHPTPG